MRFRNLKEVKKVCGLSGSLWFSPEAMKRFDGKIESGIIEGCFFITSEEFPNRQRYFSVRKANSDGTIGTVSGFGEFEKKKDARQFVLDLIGV